MDVKKALEVKKEKTAAVKKAPTRSDVIWDQIKNVEVEIYALPEQTIGKHVERLEVTDDMVHVRLKSPAILPAMELALRNVKLARGERFDVSSQKNFTVISIQFDPDNL